MIPHYEQEIPHQVFVRSSFGLGEATLESRTDIAESVLRWLEPEYVGLDPTGPEAHWDRVYYIATRWRNGPALMTGLSAIDMA